VKCILIETRREVGESDLLIIWFTELIIVGSITIIIIIILIIKFASLFIRVHIRQPNVNCK
jgi:hypothetical protein